MRRKVSLVLNSIVVVLSLALFGYTFFSKAHLTEHTRVFVTDKTISYSKPLIELTKAGLESPLSKKLISDDQRSGIEEEVTLYEADSVGYVTALTSSSRSSFGEGKAAKIKEKVRDYYQSTLSELTWDLRIFSGSNIVAGLFGLWLLITTRFKGQDKVVAFSFVVFGAVAYSTYSYIGGVSFLSILFKWHLGWWYPAGIALTILGLVFEHGLHTKQKAEQSVPPKSDRVGG